MPWNERTFQKNLIAGRYTFARAAEILMQAHQDSIEQSQPFRISASLQKTIFKRWLNFLPNFNENLPDSWSHLITPPSLAAWMAGYSHFAESPDQSQNTFLERITAALRFVPEHLAPTELSMVIFSLRNVQSEHQNLPTLIVVGNKILARTLSHFSAISQQQAFFISKQLNQLTQLKILKKTFPTLFQLVQLTQLKKALLGFEPLEKAWPTDEQILQLGFTVEQLAQLACLKNIWFTPLELTQLKKGWFTPEQIVKCFLGIQPIPDSDVKREILKALLPHIHALTDSSSRLQQIVKQQQGFTSKEKTQLLTIIHDLPNSEEKKAVSQAIFTQGSIDQPKILNPEFPTEQIISRFLSLQLIPDLIEKKELLRTLSSHLKALIEFKKLENQPISLPQWLNPKEISQIFISLQPIPDSEEKKTIVQILLPHLQALADSTKQVNQQKWLNPRQISQILASMGNMAAYPEIDEAILLILINHLQENKEDFTLEALCASIYGLRHFSSSEKIEVLLTLFSTQLDKIVNSQTWLDNDQILSLVEGLAPLSTSMAIKAIFRLLAHCLHRQNKEGFIIKLDEIVNLFYALQHKKLFSELDTFISRLTPHLEICLKEEDLLQANEFAEILHGIHQINNSPAKETLLSIITAHLIANAEREEWYDLTHIAVSIKSLSKYASTPHIERLLEALLLHIQAHLKFSHQFELKEILWIVYGLQNMEATKATDAMLRILTTHIKKTQLSSQKIARCLYGIQNMQLTQSVQIYLAALTVHLNKLAKEKVWLSAIETSYCFQAIKKLSYCQAVDDLLRALEVHSNAYLDRETSACFDSLSLANCLSSLHHIGPSETVESVLSTLTRHFKRMLAQGEKLERHIVELSVYGLQNMYSLNSALTLIKLFVPYIRDLVKSPLVESQLPREKWLAEIIFSLRLYWLAETPQKKAVAFIEKIIHSFLPRFDLDALSRNTPIYQIDTIAKMGGFAIRVQETTHHRQLNLQYCSLALTTALTEYFLRFWPEKNDRTLIIDFSAEIETQREKIIQLVDQLVPENTYHWKDSSLIITPKPFTLIKGKSQDLELTYLDSQASYEEILLSSSLIDDLAPPLKRSCSQPITAS